MAIRLALNDAYGDTSKVTKDLVNRYHDLMLRSGNRRAVIEIAENYRTENIDGYKSNVEEPSGPVLPSSCDPSPRAVDDYQISQVDVPTLFQWGEEDSWLPVSFGRELAAEVADSEFISYDGVGHVSMEESPRETAADAATFITE